MATQEHLYRVIFYSLVTGRRLLVKRAGGKYVATDEAGAIARARRDLAEMQRYGEGLVPPPPTMEDPTALEATAKDLGPFKRPIIRPDVSGRSFLARREARWRR